MKGFYCCGIICFLLSCVNPCLTQTMMPLNSLKVDSMFGQIRKSYDAGFRAESLAQLQSLKDRIHNQFERESVLYGAACFFEGTLLSNSGDYTKAEAAYLESKRIRSSIFSYHSQEYIDVLSRLSMLQTDMGKYKEAAQCVQELKEIRELALPADDPKVISTIRELGSLYRRMGTYELADSILQTQVVDEAGLDAPAALEYARLLAEMADLYREMEDFERAVPTYLKALSLYTTKKSKESGEYVALLTGLAMLYLEMGQSEESRVYLTKAKRQVETGIVFFKRIKYGPVMLALAELYRANKEFDDAEELYLDGIEEFESNLQQGFPDYAKLHYELASLYHEKQDYTLAEETYLRAIQLWESVEGARVPWYPKTIMGLAKLYQVKKNYSKAIALFHQSKLYWEATLGKEYPLYIINILDLARLSWETQQYSSADSLYAMAAELGKERLVGASQYMSARELHKYMQKIMDTQAEILSFVNQSPVTDQTVGTCYNNALFYKGFLLQNAIQIKRTALANAGSAAVFHQLNANRRLLSKEFSKPFSERRNVNLYQEQIDSLESELICMVSEVEKLSMQVEWQDIVGQLDSNEAAIEFVDFRYYRGGLTDSIMYAALVLKEGTMVPEFVPLFKSHRDNPIINSGSMDNIEYLNFLYSSDTRGLIEVENVRPNLYQLIWEPLKRSGLEGIDRIYCSPSGIIHRINLGAIQVNDDMLILDEVDILRVGSTRDIERGVDVLKDSVSVAAIFGGIDYNSGWMDSTMREANDVATKFNSALSQDRGDLDGTWNYLSGTQNEVNSLVSICQRLGIISQTYTDSFATEDVFKLLGESGAPPSPWLLHMGTHGYFYPDPKEEESDHLLERTVVFKTSNQPMLRSGLILAGANYYWKNNLLPPGAVEDGILTADEISYLDLSNTELAVLSACETGLGDIQGNEGVFGLQRAFKIAGAKYLIMSLWKIPDKESKLFMDSFYQYWLEESSSIQDAFIRAQKERQGVTSHYGWAGFILLSN